MSDPSAHVCPDCDASFKTARNLRKHQEKNTCKKPSALQCECGATFPNRQRKYDHRTREYPRCLLLLNNNIAEDTPASNSESQEDHLVDPAAPSTSGSVPSGSPRVVNTDNSVVNNTDNSVATNTVNNGTINGTINNGTINTVNHNNVVINFGANVPPRINDFMKTNTQVVIDSISRNPAFMQLAHEQNSLPEAVLAETHFHGALENRNVLSADRHGPYVNVVTNERRVAISKKIAAEQSIRNVNTIVNSPEVKPFFSDDPTKPVLPIPQTKSEARELRIRHTRLFYNKGEYLEAHDIKVPTGMPVFVPHADLVDMLLAVVDGQQSPYRHEVPMYHEFTLAACGHFVFNEATGKWFKGLPHGWEVLKDVARVESEIHIVLNDLKNAAKAKAIDDAKLRTGVDYFPDRLVASAAVGWVITASSGPALEPEKLECLEA